MTGMSQRAYAAAAGLSRGTVSELIDAGMPGRGFRAIEKESADAWRAANIDPARTDAARRGLANSAGKPRKNGKAAKISGSSKVNGASVATARRKKLEFDLKLSQLKLAERQGEVIPRETLESFLFARARDERDQWIGFIARTAPILAHDLDCDLQKSFAVLDRLIREQLLALAKELPA